MTELKTTSLAQIVNANHKTAFVFEKYNLDFCCKGKRSLQQACAENNAPVEQIIAELNNVAISVDIGTDFNKMSFSQLTDYIVLTHHAYVKQKMPSILDYLQKVTSKHGQRHPEMFKVLEIFSVVQEEMKLHMEKEELVLFPRIKALEETTIENSLRNKELSYLQSPLALLEEEHDHAGSLMDEIRWLTTNYTPPADACTTYQLSFASLQDFEFNLHQHVHLENNILFPKALNLFKEMHEASLN